MSTIRQVGVSPQQLDQRVEQERWHQWCLAEPALRTVSCLAEARKLRGAAEDQILGALLRLASQHGGDDELAGVAVIHQLDNVVTGIARRTSHLTSEDIDGIIVGAMWEQIRTFNVAQKQHFGASIFHATRRAVLAILLPDGVGKRARPLVMLDPQEWSFARASLVWSPQIDDSSEALANLLRWAMSEGLVDDSDVRLLLRLIEADRANPDIPKWNRGACSVAAVTQLAEEEGVCLRSIRRARDRAIQRLRDAASEYLDLTEVA